MPMLLEPELMESLVFDGGPHIVDISDPLEPVFAGSYSGSFYTHDAQVVTYNGPDPDYAGREIFFRK